MLRLKTLVDAQQVIDRLLALHMETTFLLPDWKERLDNAKDLRQTAYGVSMDIAGVLAVELAKKVEIHD